jgi:dephospho-CoA kinase
MLKVALTGGIATGKSHVLAKFRERGIPTIDADDLVHAAFAPATPTTISVAREFGGAVLKADGSVDRAVLASKVFSDSGARQRLEAIVHPPVYEEIRKWFGRIDGHAAVASIPLLFETRHERDFDVIIVTACTVEQQQQRLIERGLSVEDARLRIAAQIPTENKVRRANHVIWTSGTMAETDVQVDDVITMLAQQNDGGL